MGYGKIASASRMNKAVVVFLSEEELVMCLAVNGIQVSGSFLPVSPLISPAVKVTISNILPFILNAEVEQELSRFRKFASLMKPELLNCRKPALKHVVSFRRQIYMFLNEPSLDASFRFVHEGKSYMIYANTGNMMCFECGDIGHKRLACPHKEQRGQEEGLGGVGDWGTTASENSERNKTSEETPNQGNTSEEVKQNEAHESEDVIGLTAENPRRTGSWNRRLSAEFYKRFWQLIGKDLLDVFTTSFSTGF